MNLPKVLKFHVRRIAHNRIEATSCEYPGECCVPVEGIDAFPLVGVVGGKAFVEFWTDQAIALSDVVVER